MRLRLDLVCLAERHDFQGIIGQGSFSALRPGDLAAWFSSVFEPIDGFDATFRSPDCSAVTYTLFPSTVIG